MTLPTTARITSEEFNHFDTMSYVASADEHTAGGTQSTARGAQSLQLPQRRPLPQQQEQQQQQQQQQQRQRQQQLNATASTCVYSSLELAVENVMPGIFLTKNFIAWNEENLRAHGFTHVIIIDKHIQELYYPSPVFKLASNSSGSGSGNSTANDRRNNNAAASFDAASAFEYFGSCGASGRPSLSFGKEFEAIDLNFGEKSYLTTVLPNCYRAVKFINKAQQAGGTTLIIDCNGGEQKCVTIVVAYLMYKHNISFSNAFARLKDYYKKADLDRFYISQLYEYEPILQVQRAQSRGHSCSRELHSAILKRKKVEDDTTTACSIRFSANPTTSQFFDTLNPLTQFNAVAHQPQPQQQQEQQQQQQHDQESQDHDYLAKSPPPPTQHNQQQLGWPGHTDSTWYDYDFME